MKVYLIITDGQPFGCYTNEDIADKHIESISKFTSACKVPLTLEIDEETIKELAINVLDDIEDMLADKEIMIPDRCREGNEEEACLYGETYYNLEDKVIETITNTLEEE